MSSIAAIPAFTTGDSSPGAAEPWKTRTRTSAPPGGDVIDIVVDDGSGAGSAPAAGPDSNPAARRAAVRDAARTRLPARPARAPLDVLDVPLAPHPRRCSILWCEVNRMGSLTPPRSQQRRHGS
ncbi:hypothetical protein GCM10023220_53690 [Streptomyces ziwulingensis]|uniref:Uncharacterized protein n=1 Tax=Streptomyces ziwulingensis TaxID=1045501 RepID=A0ABP9CPF0_9ACTN